MFSLDLSDLSPQSFLDAYWQKKPMVIRQGFKDFQDPISADELAGLACDEQVESRLVYKKDGAWQAEFGPFQSYEHLGEKAWTLVVQAVDHWSPDVAELIEPFRFLPNWRLDDLMISYACPGGGVGPHIDLYDVFIIQGSGKRRWRVGDLGEYEEFAAHPALLHVEDFDPIIDVELNPGDILYIPPGFPHDGVTLEPSLSFSVGFRTSSGYDWVDGLADFLAEHKLARGLISDPDRNATTHPGEIGQRDFALMKQHIVNIVNDDELLRRFAGEYLSQAKHTLDLVEVEDDLYSGEEVIALLQQGALLKRLGGLRCLYFESTLPMGLFYIDGKQMQLPVNLQPVIQLLCDRPTIPADRLLPWMEEVSLKDFLTEQLNAGYWYFERQENT
ncbi:MAG: cupin domain-containing protein [Gammaproteobacteria bacterium]|nr:cupin domain-containing protein [Gammaproteobacteria bacterium]